MKTPSQLIILALITVFTFSACSVFPENTPAAPNNENITVKEVPTGATDEPIAETKPLSCESLKDLSLRSQCEVMQNDIVAGYLQQEILLSFDINRCSELPLPLSEDCQQILEESGVKGPASKEDTDLLNEIYMSTMSPSGEIQSSKCAALKTPGLSAFCAQELSKLEDQNAYMSILDSGDVTKCEEIKTQELQMECKEILSVNEMSEEVTEEIPTPAE